MSGEGRKNSILDKILNAEVDEESLAVTETENRYKILFVGDGGVGKTSLVDRFCREKFQENRPMTLGLEQTKIPLKMGGKENVFMFWDIAGQKRWQEIAKSWFRGSNAVYGVLDITRRETLDNLVNTKNGWLQRVWDICKDRNMKILIIGNKSDMSHQRQVSYKEGVDWAKHWNAAYFETSASDGTNVVPALTFMFYDLSKTIPEDSAKGLSKIYKGIPSFEELDKKYLVELIEQVGDGIFEQAIPEEVGIEIRKLSTSYSFGDVFSGVIEKMDVTPHNLIESLKNIPDEDIYQVKKIMGIDTYKSILSKLQYPIPGSFNMEGFEWRNS